MLFMRAILLRARIIVKSRGEIGGIERTDSPAAPNQAAIYLGYLSIAQNV
jgi:hypothetical protein